MNAAQELKCRVRDNILLGMQFSITKEAMQTLEMIIEKEFVKINMEEITTLPASVDNSTEQQNNYIINLFLIKKKNLAEKTKEQYISAVKRLLVLVDKPITEIGDMDVSYYLRWYERKNELAAGKRNNATTVNNERRFLSAFFTWMRKSRLIQENPVDSTEPKRVIRKPIDYFKPEQMEELREGSSTLRDRAIVEVLRSTGVRVNELVPVNRQDVDWTTGDMAVIGEKGSGFGVTYLDEQARYHLKKYLDSRTDSNEALFVWEKAPYKRLKAAGIRASLNGIKERQNMQCRVYPHKLRKTLGMHLKQQGQDIGIIQEVLRHRSPATTSQYYAESTAETLRDFRRRAA